MVRHFVVTLPAGPVDLGDPLQSGLARIDVEIGFGTLLFQGLKANTNDIFVGATKDGAAASATPVSSSNHGFRVDPGDTAPPVVLRRGLGGVLSLKDFTVAGTAGEKLCILAVED